MQHIKLFEQFVTEGTKTYADRITLAKFKSIKPGTKLTYYGNSYTVKSNDGYVLTLTDPTDGETVDVNFNMFNQKGYMVEGWDFDQFDRQIDEINATIQKMGKKKFYYDFTEDAEFYYNAEETGRSIQNTAKKIGEYLEKKLGVKYRVEENDNLTTLIIDIEHWF